MPRGKAAKSLQLIEACASILEEIQPATVRAVCYQLFNVHRLIPDMSKNSTNKVGVQLTDARKSGMIPWEWIVDETRPEEKPASWDDPAAYAEVVTRAYRRNWWNDQPYDVKVWSEKSTVAGTLRPVLRDYGVGFSAIHGFGSTTKLHDLADFALTLDKPMVILYIGDYDPSGLYMSEVDLFKRLRVEDVEVYAWADVVDPLTGRLPEADGIPVLDPGTVVVHRLALTQDDVRPGGVPPFAVEDKKKDSRYAWFRARYGTRCAELDALNPAVLRDRVRQAIESLLDREAWDTARQIEKLERESITDVLGKWKDSLRISVPA